MHRQVSGGMPGPAPSIGLERWFIKRIITSMNINIFK
jgi:hypothetical protein